MIPIDIRSLKEGFQELEFAPAADALGLEDPKMDDVFVEAQVTVDGDQIIVRVSAKAIAHLMCDRTLTPFDQPIEGTYTVCFMPEAMMDEDAENDDIQSLPSDLDEIDLTDIVRDTLMLAVPVRKIAPGAEDMDIPTTFGDTSESEIDPRWKGLEKLRSS
jgi:uncharacterized protein